jgi:phospholipid-binding lipoprotein MlaA
MTSLKNFITFTILLNFAHINFCAAKSELKYEFTGKFKDELKNEVNSSQNIDLSFNSLRNNKEDDFNDFDNFDDFSDFEALSNKEPIVIKDPYENFNRKIYTFNDYFDRYFFEHVVRTYRKTLPKKIRNPIHNFISNITLPMSAFNSFLQGDIRNGLATTSTFLINSTIGIGGLFTVAQNKGITFDPEDFGQTLAFYRFKSGPYLMIPFLGPSSTRDFAGWIVDKAIDPSAFNAFEIAKNKKVIESSGFIIAYSGLSAVDTRERLIEILDDIRKESFDPYATIRSAYFQRRSALIKNHK